MFDKLVIREGSKFYKIEDDAVESVQKKLGIILPQQLKQFYEEIGYGFLGSEGFNFNRIMDPVSLCEFRFRVGQFEDDSELDVYEQCERDTLIFFEVCEGFYLGMGFSKNNDGEIFYRKEKIAESLVDFLVRFQEDEKYMFKK